ncbi:hypothetical protein AYO49_03975 [Verrucomicrobiaceae bacterium SCGC AG-212-N21]|nr:hypothetical protein AYO49_03975 [Verrucomicrobiaceae bacterium SCGC AG-212-N21]
MLVTPDPETQELPHHGVRIDAQGAGDLEDLGFVRGMVLEFDPLCGHGWVQLLMNRGNTQELFSA